MAAAVERERRRAPLDRRDWSDKTADRFCELTADIYAADNDDTDYSFGNVDLYQPLLIADGIVGFNCRVVKKAEDAKGNSARNSGENDKEKFEAEFAESNSVPYKVELTFQIERPDDSFRSQTKRAPLVRIVRIPIHEQSLDGSAPPGGEGKEKKGGKKTGEKRQ